MVHTKRHAAQCDTDSGVVTTVLTDAAYVLGLAAAAVLFVAVAHLVVMLAGRIARAVRRRFG